MKFPILIACTVYLISESFANGAKETSPFTIAENNSSTVRNGSESSQLSRIKPRCRNGGVFANNRCQCPHPYTGEMCEDFKCVNGFSVGKRYDQNSLLFSKPCICEEGWKGDLCEYRLTSKCSNRGEWKDNRCECIGHFFGDECQYTNRCDFGVIKHGRCICHKSFEGPYCERIVCYKGYANPRNQSRSCVCPVKYKGQHCDMCAQSGPHILPYPKCVVDFVPQAKFSRSTTNQQIKSRVMIIVGAIAFLVVIALSMLLLHAWSIRHRNPQEDEQRRQELAERRQMLAEAADKSESDNYRRPRRKSSILNFLRLNRKQSTSELRSGSVTQSVPQDPKLVAMRRQMSSVL